LKQIYYCLLLVFLFILSPLLKKKRWKLVFIINAGAPEVLSQIIPNPLIKFLLTNSFFKQTLFPTGFIFTSSGYGLTLANCATNQEIKSSKALIIKHIDQLNTYSASKIALGGVLPSAISSFSLYETLSSKFVTQTHGTVYMLLEAIEKSSKKNPHLYLNQRPIAVIGAGYTGLALVSQLTTKNMRVNLFDIVSKTPSDPQKNIRTFYGSNSFGAISKAGIVVLLTTNGDEGLTSILPHLLPNMTVLSDTYPRVSNHYQERLIEKGVLYYECYANINKTKLSPNYGHISQDIIGGCMLQACVESQSGNHFHTYESFSKEAKKQNAGATLHSPLIRVDQ
jgi:hypothetical protein